MVPDLSHGAKIAYAAVTYIACNILYTGINTPVTAILSALTSDPREREVLTTFRMVGSKLGVLIVNLVGLELVSVLGQGNDRRGFMLAVPLFAALSWGLFLLAFRNLKETLPVETKPLPLGGSFGALRGNWPWLIIFASSFLFWVGFIARATITPLFFGDVLGRPDLTKIANALDFASLATALLLPWMCRKTSKTTVWILGLAGMVLGQAVVLLGIAQGHSLNLIMAGWALGFIASGAAMAMPFAVLSDSVDFGEWKTGIRAVGLLTAVGAAFCLKAGAGLGGALPMWIIGAAGYISTEAGQPVVAQPATALRALDFCVSWLPGLTLAAAALPVFFYGRYERMEPRIQADLATRRGATAA
jgi:Na+/melibiose symporter-like transporter